MPISAKVVLRQKVATASQGDSLALLTFEPDYADGRNAEWAYATPHLTLSMTVRGDVAEKFTEGERYTLIFEPSLA